MIKTLSIQNFGNIKSLSIELGKINVFIGADLAGQLYIFDEIDRLITDENLAKGIVPECHFPNPISIEDFGYIKDRLIDWFFPILKDLKLHEHDNEWFYQSEYDDKWHWDRAVSYVARMLHGALSPKSGDVGLEEDFGECLNPRLSRRLLSEMIEISEKNNKQIILFTHQPNTLDALNLNDDDHRLFTVGFWLDNSCRVTRINAPKPLEGQKLVPLSEAFMRGYIGGLPEGF